MSVEFITAKEAVAKIKDNDLVVAEGFIGAVVPEELFCALEDRFLQDGSPKNITLMYAAGVGDGKDKGLNRLGHEGLLGTVIGGHWGLAPKVAKLAIENKVQAYNLPQGVISHMFRDIAAKRPATISTVGLGTFVDPDLEGGKINEVTKKDMVTKINILGKECLCYEHPTLNVGLLRGTLSDKQGNIALNKEALVLEGLAIAMAIKNNGGTVIVQVEDIVEDGEIPPHQVVIPSILVDYVVKVQDKANHMQTFATEFNEHFVKNSPNMDIPFTSLELDERKIIARRCAMLLDPSMKNINYGIGMPEGVSSVLHEEDADKNLVPSVEPGAIGGVPMGGLDFGASLSPIAIIDQPAQFDFYDGGGLDIAFLGLAQCDEVGNINVSKFGPKIAGCGGFINITQNAGEVVFCGTFTAGGLKIAIEDGKLQILQEGKSKKFIKAVEQVTFSAETAIKNNKKVTYVTERAVFVLTPKGLELIEIADGIDLEKDVLAHMDFKPIISDNLKKMDSKIFQDKLMGLKLQ